MPWMPIATAPKQLRDLATVVEQHYAPPKLRWQLTVDLAAIVVFYLGEVAPPKVTQYFVLPDVADE